MLSPQFINNLWYGKHYLSVLLLPVSWLYAGFMLLRRLAYVSGILPVQQIGVPIIVVGNIIVGGTGKTPLIIWLVEFLKEKGYRPGVISRGYGGSAGSLPQQVRADSSPYIVGDEPVLIAQRSDCAVAVSTKRYAAAKELAKHTDCDILLCDDGLQHYALHCDIEIVVTDDGRQFGNNRYLPAGPLRESVKRLDSVDMVVCNGREDKNQYKMEYSYSKLVCLNNNKEQQDLEYFSGRAVHAVAGIGNPEHFFSKLCEKNILIIKHIFPDHYPYKENDVLFDDNLPVIMTEKDAVKCRRFARENFWYLPISANMTSVFKHRLTTLLAEINNG